MVLRDTSAGSGLLMVEGRQVPFHLEGVWRSPVAPRPDMRVEVSFDAHGSLIAISVLPPQPYPNGDGRCVIWRCILRSLRK